MASASNKNSSLDDHSRTIIHIDLDCFYAQVEINKNESLRDVPLGIQQKNIVVTSNYKARSFGIKKCMLITEAKKLCPNLVLVNGEDLHDYRQVSYKVTNLLESYSNLVERLGLDENFVDVSEKVQERLAGCKSNDLGFNGHIYDEISEKCDCGCTNRIKMGSIIAQEIRNLIKNELNLTSTAGIAHNKLLAKIVGSKNKPDQQTLIFPNSAVQLMISLPNVNSIPGIGLVMADQLTKINIKTVEDLQNAKNTDLQLALNIPGNKEEKIKWLKNVSFGIDDSAVKATGKPQSIGIEDSCKSISALNEIESKIRQLLKRLLLLMKEDGRLPKTIKLTIRKLNKKSSNRETRQCNINPSILLLKNAETVENKLMSTLMLLFSKLVDIRKSFHITLIGLSFSKFTNNNINNNKMNESNLIDKFFYRNDIEVQSITNIESSNNYNNSDSEDNNNHKIDNEIHSKTNELSLSEPSTSKSVDPLIFQKNKKIKLDLKLELDNNFKSDKECESPCKLQIADLTLAASEVDLYEIPPNVDKDVFRELPREMQQEIWNEYKQQRNKNVLHPAKKSKPNNNTILNYFVKN